MSVGRRCSLCAIGVSLLMLSACGGDDDDSGANTGATTGADVEGVVWVLDDIDGEAVPDGVEVTLEYDGESIAGNGGCNQYNGAASFDDGAVDISPGIAATLMLCPEPASTIEQRYFAALPTADGFRVDGDTLVLTSGDEPVLVFAAG